MPHVVLVGDSIFDNRVYTGGGPDVVTQLRQVLPADWTATLVAVDGHMTGDIRHQLTRLPTDSTHLALSVGGNDALSCLPVLDVPAADVRQGIATIAAVTTQFEVQYVEAVEACLRTGLPLVLCTIYNGCFADAAFQRIATTIVALFDDVILRTAAGRGRAAGVRRAGCSQPGA